MSNQIADGANGNYIQYWLNQTFTQVGQYTIGRVTYYNLSFTNPSTGSFPNILLFPVAVNSCILVTLQFAAVDPNAEASYTGYVVIPYSRLTGNIIQTIQILNIQDNPNLEAYSLQLTPIGGNVSLGVFGPKGMVWTGKVEVLKCP